jgi:hypothetical protein
MLTAAFIEKAISEPVLLAKCGELHPDHSCN